MSTISRTALSLLISLPVWGVILGCITLFVWLEEYLVGLSDQLILYLIIGMGVYSLILPFLIFRTLATKSLRAAINKHIRKPALTYFPWIIFFALVIWGWSVVSFYGMPYAKGNPSFRGFAILFLLYILFDEVNKLMNRSDHLKNHLQAQQQGGEYARPTRLSAGQLKIAIILQSVAYFLIWWGLMMLCCQVIYHYSYGYLSLDSQALLYIPAMGGIYWVMKQQEQKWELVAREHNWIPWDSTQKAH